MVSFYPDSGRRHLLQTRDADSYFHGIEPMMKSAVKFSRTGVILVMATHGTLKSHHYERLKSWWASKLTVIEPDCDRWAATIERGDADLLDIEPAIKEALRWHADTIILGCAQYRPLKSRIHKIAGPHILVLEPTDTR